MQRANRAATACALGLVWECALFLTWPAPPARAFEDRIQLGSSEAALRETFGEQLTPVTVRSSHPIHAARAAAPHAPEAKREANAEAASDAAPSIPEDPYTGQRRLARAVASEDVRRVEYDLFEGRVVRIRWRLGDRFARPIMAGLVDHLSERLGTPDYDQTIEAKLGSGKATLRRAGWTKGTRAVEVRQLHPLNGGPIYVTRSDRAALQEIVAAGHVLMPEPDTSEAWWRRAQAPPAMLSASESERLISEAAALVGPGP